MGRATVLFGIVSNWRQDPVQHPAWRTGPQSLLSLLKKTKDLASKNNSFRNVMLFQRDTKLRDLKRVTEFPRDLYMYDTPDALGPIFF